MKISAGKKSFEPQRIFCIGRNYVSHVREFDDDIPEKPIIFMKPATSLVPEGEKINFPKHGKDFHYEAELVALIGKDGRPKNVKEAISFIAGISLGFDLTLRDLQQKLVIPGGLPWEITKSFDQSAPLGGFVPLSKIKNLKDIEFVCKVNGKIKQRGQIKNMIFPVEKLVLEISKIWKLVRGDLIYTGTPSGVGPLKHGNVISAESRQIGSFSWKIK